MKSTKADLLLFTILTGAHARVNSPMPTKTEVLDELSVAFRNPYALTRASLEGLLQKEATKN